MEDLSHWDFQDLFSASEASKLICGIDPKSKGGIDGKYTTIYNRMEKDFECARLAFALFMTPFDADDVTDLVIPIDSLSSSELRGWIHQYIHLNNEVDSWDWVMTVKGNLDDLTFSRDDLSKWLNANNLPSKYEFSRPVLVQETAVEKDKSLSTRERNTLLTIIAVLCHEYKLDYTKPAKTAGLIQGMADFMKVSISESAIEGHLKKIPDALGTRTR